MTRGAGRNAAAPAAGGVRVTFYARAVAAGEAWRQVAERNFDSARGCEEFVGSLDVPDEPSVLRALMVYRGESRTHEWLCDPAASPRPARIDPTFGWSLDDKAAMWAAGRPWTDAWEACPSPAWLLLAANAARVDPLTCVRATAAAAQLAAAGDPPDREATALLWVALAALDDPNPAAAAEQLDRILAVPAPAASSALRAARAVAACASRNLLHPGTDQAHMHIALTYVADHFEFDRPPGPDPDGRVAAARACADALRGALPLLDVLRAAAGGAR